MIGRLPGFDARGRACASRRAGLANMLILGTFLVPLQPALAQESPLQALLPSVIPPASPAPAIRGRGEGYAPPEALREGRAAAGIRAGQFYVQRRAQLRSVYDDNIDSSNDNRRDDILVSGDAAVGLRSAWRRHALGGELTAGYDRFLQNPDESDVRWRLNTDGRLDFTRQTSAEASLGYTRDREDRSSADASLDSEDDIFHDIDASLRLNQRGRIAHWSVGLAAERIEFEDSRAADRDRSEFTLDLQTHIELGPRLVLSLTPEASRLNYDTTDDLSGVDRDETRYAFTTGLAYQASDHLIARGAIGYAFEYYDDSIRDDSQGIVLAVGADYRPSRKLGFSIDVIYDQAEDEGLEDSGSTAIEAEAKLNYTFDERTALALTASRALRESDIAGANEEIDTDVGLTLTRSLNESMTLTFLAGLSRQEFDGTDREDDGFQVGLAYDWAFLDWMNFTLAYRYRQRDSDLEEDDFYRNVISAGLSAQF